MGFITTVHHRAAEQDARLALRSGQNVLGAVIGATAKNDKA